MTLVAILALTKPNHIPPFRCAQALVPAARFENLHCHLLFPHDFATKPNPAVEYDPMTPHIVDHGWNLRILRVENRHNICCIGIWSSAN